MQHTKSFCYLLATIAMLAASGCSDGRPTRVPVSGQVLIDGQPLRHGKVRFYPVGGRVAGGNLNENGRFTLSCYDVNDGVAPGEQRIEVDGAEVVGPERLKWHAPKKYASYATSGLTQTIKSPADDVRIEISWEGSQPFVENLAPADGGGDGDLERSRQRLKAAQANP